MKVLNSKLDHYVYLDCYSFTPRMKDSKKQAKEVYINS